MLPTFPGPWRWCCFEYRDDPMARVCGVDTIVNFEMSCRIQAFASTVGFLHHLLIQRGALLDIQLGFELPPSPELHRAFKAHATILGRRPAHTGEWRLETSPGHGLCAEAIPLACHDR